MKQLTLSAGAVPVNYKDGEWRFLILRAFNFWDFPKGMVEPDEDPWQAAVREVEEETGLNSFVTPKGQLYIETEPYGKGKVARYYLIEIKKPGKIRLEANPITGIIEHHEYRWVSYEEARELLVPRIQKVIDWAYLQLREKN